MKKKMFRNRAKMVSLLFFFPKVKSSCLLSNLICLNKTQTFFVKNFSTRSLKIRDFCNQNRQESPLNLTLSNGFYRKYHILYVSDSDSEDYDYDGDCDYVNDYDYEKDDSEDSDDSDGYNRKHIENSIYEGTIEELDDFCRKHKVKEAVDVLDILEYKGVDVDFPRYVELIKLCRDCGVLEYAQFVHHHLIRLRKDNQDSLYYQDSLYNELLDMFLKCDSVSDAYEVFYNMPKDNSTVWDTMIMAFARNGYGEEAIKLFTRFLGAGFIPDGQIYLGVPCSSLCDVDEGMLHFKSMRNVYGIVPSMKHYVIVVDMLGSAGCLDEAMKFIDKMPFEASVDIWETLMNHCRIHGNNVLENHCAEIINNIDKSKDGFVPVKASDLAIEDERLSCQYIKVTEDDNELNTRDTSQPEIDEFNLLVGEPSEIGNAYKRYMKKAFLPTVKTLLLLMVL